MTDPRETRLPGESPCFFVHGQDGWTNCAIHGWTGFKEQRSRVLVCPDAASPGARHDVPDLEVERLREASLVVEAGYILMPDRTKVAYWQKIAAEYARLSPEPAPPVLVPRDEPTREDIEG